MDLIHYGQVDLKNDCKKVICKYICKYDKKTRIFYNGKINFECSIDGITVFALLDQKEHFSYIFQTCGNLLPKISIDSKKCIVKLELEDKYFCGEDENEKNRVLTKNMITCNGFIIIYIYMNNNKWKKLIELFKEIILFTIKHKKN